MLYHQLCLPVKSAELLPLCDPIVFAVTLEVNGSRMSVLSFPPPSFLPLENLFVPLSLIITSTCRTWENLGGGKFWQIWQTVGNSQKFSPPIFINAIEFSINYQQIHQFFPRQRL